jgi:hypothetical protein
MIVWDGKSTLDWTWTCCAKGLARGRKRMREKKKRRKIGVFAVDEHVVEV